MVLVRPKGSGNIGSVARAMKNTGLRDLALVGRGRTDSFSARAMAAHSRDILDGARRFDTLREAVADCGLVVGTTCRKGLYRDHVERPREAAAVTGMSAFMRSLGRRQSGRLHVALHLPRLQYLP